MFTVAVPSSTDFSSLSSLQRPYEQRAAEWRHLAHALRAGDLASAQDAFNNILALRENAPHGGRFPNQQVARDFDALAQALDAGDLEAAQQAFAALRHDVRAARRPTAGRFFDSDRGSDGPGPGVIVNLSGDSRGAASGQAATSAAASSSSAPAPAATPAPVTTSNSPLPPISSSVGTTSLPTTTSSSSGVASGSSSEDASAAVTFNFGYNRPGQSSWPEIVFNLGNGGSASDVTLTLDRRGSRSELDIQFANGPEIDFNFRGRFPAIIFNVGSGESDASQSSGVQINLQA